MILLLKTAGVEPRPAAGVWVPGMLVNAGVNIGPNVRCGVPVTACVRLGECVGAAVNTRSLVG